MGSKAGKRNSKINGKVVETFGDARQIFPSMIIVTN
jgi:hypothetical protein